MNSLLRTKLFIPVTPPQTILRPRLLERLQRSLAGKLTLITAQTGYGKTTLVTTWLDQLSAQDRLERDAKIETVWLSLDAGDNDLRRFFTYFLATLAQLDKAFGETADRFLQDAREMLVPDLIVTDLLNQLVHYDQPVLLVLDDYHEIENQDIHNAVTFLLDNQPPNFHLILTSRTEPPLPLSRWRVRRQVTEIDAAVLRFSRAETAEFLNQQMHLDLSADDIDQLESITEGWVASLQLAALSLQNSDDPSQFIQNFKGDNHYIVDYLVSEVLQHQPGYIRDFLLQTSILERLNVQLCNAVTQQVGSQHILEMLDQQRLFVIPLDGRRHWYRYHHLFAECLQAELARTAADQLSAYHERASLWLSAHGFLDEAIRHALTAKNDTLTADLIAANVRPLLWEQGAHSSVWQWITQLPDIEIAARPTLLIAKAWIRLELFLDHSHQIDELLDAAVILVEAQDAPYSATETVEIITEIALIQTSLARLRGNLSKAVQHSERAVALIQTVDSSILKVGAARALAITYYQAGNMRRSLEQSSTRFAILEESAQTDYAYLLSLSYTIDALRLHGQLEKAATTFRQIASAIVHRQSVGAAMVIVSWAEVLRERNQFPLAADYLIPALETLKPQPSMAVIVQTGAITLARIWHAQGKRGEALKLLQETLRDFRAEETYYPSARVSAALAHLHLQQGNLAAAKAWAEKCGLHANDDPDFHVEIDHLVLARVLITNGAAPDALRLLTKLEESANAGGRVARLIEIQTIQALAHQALGQSNHAIQQLEKALDLAAPEGFVRTFVDEGASLVPLLQKLAGRGTAVGYIRQLLTGMDAFSQPQLQARSIAQTTAPTTPYEPPADAFDLLLNPLTDRELATLRYLASELTIPEIADQLIVAPSTVRTYVKQIYSKLDAHTRIEAVIRARTLALIP